MKHEKLKRDRLAYNRKWREENREYSRSYMRAYYAEHPELKVSKRKREAKWRKDNPEKARAIARRYYHNCPPERRRAISRRAHLKKSYRMTEQQWDAMFQGQGERCAACRSVKAGYSHAAARKFHTDHCHKTGIVRGILCHPCNVILGNAGDSIEHLQLLIKYLRKWQKLKREE